MHLPIDFQNLDGDHRAQHASGSLFTYDGYCLSWVSSETLKHRYLMLDSLFRNFQLGDNSNGDSMVVTSGIWSFTLF